MACRDDFVVCFCFFGSTDNGERWELKAALKRGPIKETLVGVANANAWLNDVVTRMNRRTKES